MGTIRLLALAEQYRLGARFDRSVDQRAQPAHKLACRRMQESAAALAQAPVSQQECMQAMRDWEARRQRPVPMTC